MHLTTFLSERPISEHVQAPHTSTLHISKLFRLPLELRLIIFSYLESPTQTYIKRNRIQPVGLIHRNIWQSLRDWKSQAELHAWRVYDMFARYWSARNATSEPVQAAAAVMRDRVSRPWEVEKNGAMCAKLLDQVREVSLAASTVRRCIIAFRDLLDEYREVRKVFAPLLVCRQLTQDVYEVHRLTPSIIFDTRCTRASLNESHFWTKLVERYQHKHLKMAQIKLSSPKNGPWLRWQAAQLTASLRLMPRLERFSVSITLEDVLIDMTSRANRRPVQPAYARSLQAFVLPPILSTIEDMQATALTEVHVVFREAGYACFYVNAKKHVDKSNRDSTWSVIVLANSNTVVYQEDVRVRGT